MSTERTAADHLDQILNASAPPTTEPTDLSRIELNRLIADAKTSGPARTSGRRLVGGAVVAGIVLGAGSLVAATSLLDSVPWINDADRSEAFVTPRNQFCEAVFRLINDDALKSSNPEAHAALEVFLADFEPTSEAITEEALSMAAATAVLDDTGEQTTLGELFNADDIERMARERVVGAALQEQAEKLGVAGRADLEGVSVCDD